MVLQHQKTGYLHEQTKTTERTRLLHDYRFGREEVTNHIEKHHPELSENHKKAQELLQKVAQLRQNQRQQEREKEKEKQKDQSDDRGFGMGR